MARREEEVEVEGPAESVGQLVVVGVEDAAARRVGTGARIAVVAELAGRRAQTSLVRRKGGGYRLYLPRELREGVGVSPGDVVSVRIAPDPLDGEPALPEALLDRLRCIEGGMEKLRARSPADRRQLVRWLAAARGADTYERRLEVAVERILGRKPTPRRKPRA